MARTGDLEKNSSNPAFAQIFVKDFDRKAQSDAYLYEKLDGEKGEFRTLAEFAEFVGPGDQNGFKNGANLVTVVSYLTSQELPLFLNAAILKSASTPIKSATGEPIFFISNLTSIYSLKKRADGGIMLTYKGTCSPEGIRVSSDVIAASIKLRSPGSVTIECDIIFRPNGDIEYGNVRSHAQGLDF